MSKDNLPKIVTIVPKFEQVKANVFKFKFQLQNTKNTILSRHLFTPFEFTKYKAITREVDILRQLFDSQHKDGYKFNIYLRKKDKKPLMTSAVSSRPCIETSLLRREPPDRGSFI